MARSGERAGGEALYVREPDAALRIVPLDAMTLIHHRASGQTHVVASPVPEILDSLGERPMTVAALMARMAARFDLADPDPRALAARLEELAEAGLVRRG